MTNIRRRDALKYAAAISASIASPLGLAQGTSPIRIGATMSLSGPMAVYGQDLLAGAEVAASQINRDGGLLGRKVELVIRDDKASSTQSVANIREFTGSGINLIAGSTMTATVLANIPSLEEGNAVQLAVNTTGMSVTHEKFSRHVFRINSNEYMQMRAYGALAAELYPNVTRWTCMLPELETTRTTWELFKKALVLSYKGINKQVTFADPILSKLTATDFKNQVAAATRSDADGILQLVFGQGAVTMFQQGKALGLQDKFKVWMDRGTDPTFVKALGSLLPGDYWMMSGWFPELYRSRPQSVAFEKEVAAVGNGRPASGFHYAGHLGVMALASGVRGARSTDTAAVIRAMETMPIESATGPVRFRKEDHQLLCDLNIMQVEAQDTVPEKYRAVRTKLYPAADLIEPASPGRPFVL